MTADEPNWIDAALRAALEADREREAAKTQPPAREPRPFLAPEVDYGPAVEDRAYTASNCHACGHYIAVGDRLIRQGDGTGLHAADRRYHLNCWETAK